MTSVTVNDKAGLWILLGDSYSETFFITGNTFYCRGVDRFHPSCATNKNQLPVSCAHFAVNSALCAPAHAVS